MGETFDGWTWWLEDSYLIHSPDEPNDWVRPKHMKAYSDDRPYLTKEQEIVLINQQIEASEGFDIDFKMFRCLFSYHPVDFNSNRFVEEPETNADLLQRLSRKSLDNYNQENKTGYEFYKLLYANFHMSAGVMFLITFQAKDPIDNLPKDFQARIRYSFVDESNFVFCRLKPKPKQQDSSIDDEDVEKDLKKPRLEEELFNGCFRSLYYHL